MKFLKNLLGRKEPEGPRWKVKPPDERPAPRRRVAAAETAPVQQKKEKNPFLDNDFEEMELMNDVAPVKVDPYSSNSWKYEQESDTRKLKTLHLVSKGVNKSADEDFNPYDTGVFRNGWKD